MSGPSPDEIRERTKVLWGLGDYARVAERLMPAAEALVEAAGVRAGQRVLDVAAGTGNVAAAAAGCGASITATDLAPHMVELGRVRTGGLDVTWAEADAENLPYEDGSFDAALSVFGAMFAPDQDAAARELLRVVKPGGWAAMTAWVPEGMQAAVAAHLAETLNGPTMMNDWGRPEFARERLTEAGASEVVVEERTLRWAFDSKEAWLDFFENGPGPLVAAKAAMGDAWPAVRSRFLEIVEEHTGAGDGPFVIEPPYLLIRARF